MKRICIVLAAIYLLSYVIFRSINSEISNESGLIYVIYPTSPIAIYYIFRPLASVDASITGMRSHIGPHE